MHTNAFLKASVLISTKARQNIFVHTSIFGLFSRVHTIFRMKTHILDMSSLIVHTKTPENADGNDSM